MILTIILLILDLITTTYCVSKGAKEINIIPYNIFIPLKVIILIGVIIIVILLKKEKINLKWQFMIVNIVYSIATINNLVQIILHCL